MSSLKNAMKSQRTHKERSQPEARRELGLLEKKKDYRLRAKDYNEKKQTLKRLRKQALNKNPDEFYHHMINSKVEDGKHREKAEEDTLTPEQVALMQTRDLAYVVHKRTAEQRKIERMKASLHMLDVEVENEDDAKFNKHTFFVDGEKEKLRFDAARRLSTHPTLLGRTFNRPRLSSLASGAFPAELATSEAAEKKKAKAYKELKQRMEREKQLGVVQAKMEVKRALQSKTEKPVAVVRKESKHEAAILKWPKERKR